LIDLIIHPSHILKHAKIEPLIIPEEKLEELKTVLADPKLPDARKSFVMRGISGSCSVCGKLPSHKVTYCKYGATIIERYCDECLERTRT
jgi:hypothetical protein